MRAWKPVAAILFCCLAVCCRTPDACALEQVHWVGSVKQAQQIAKARHRLVLLHFRGNNCPPCDRMDDEVFTRSEVARAIEINYVPVKINVDESPELKTHYKVSQWPTDIFITPDGQEIRRSIGALSADKYINIVDETAAHYRVNSTRTQSQLASTDPKDFVRDGEARSNQLQTVQYNQDPSRARAPSPSQRNSGSDYEAATSQYRQGEYRQGQWRQNEQSSAEYGAYRSPHVAGESSFPAQPADDGRRTQYPPSNEAPASTEPMTPSVGQTTPYPGQENPYSNPAARVAQADSSSGYGPMNQGGASERSSYAAPPSSGAGYGGSYAPMNDDRSSRQYASEGAAQFQPPANSNDGQAPAAATAPPPLAMDGYCPVALCERQKWLKGDRRYGAIHRGRTYLFLSQAEQQMFLENPDRYSPILSGCDVVKFVDRGEFVDGLRRYGTFLDHHVFLFADEEGRDAFEKNPKRYAQAALQAMQDAGATLR